MEKRIGGEDLMTRQEMISFMLAFIAETFPEEEMDLENVDPDMPLREQLALDSVAFLEIVMDLQMRFGIDVPEEDYIELTTLNRCVDYLTPRFELVSGKISDKEEGDQDAT
jgi:acyl carrier protein